MMKKLQKLGLMKKHILFLALSFSFMAFASLGFSAEMSMLDSNQNVHIVINNRILAKANGKAISVIDVMKKMDMLFYRQFPQYTSSVQARFQFYQVNWKRTLNEIIDKELILVDAEELKVVVSPGDVRQEMETLFGPNIIVNLDKVGLTFDEAYKMVQDEMTIRRMLHFRVQLQVINDITPQCVRSYYDTVAKDNIRDNEWIFNVVTIRQRDSDKAADAANMVYHLLSDEKVPLTDLKAKMEELKISAATQQGITISEEFKTKEKELSDAFKKVLVTVPSGSYSMPILQKNRSDNSSLFRIFYLKKMTPGGVVPFTELESKIRAKLINEGIDSGTDAYFKRQREHFDVQDDQIQELLSSDFQPFILR